MLGKALPSTPKGARESARVGAPARLPARLTSPTRRNETHTPTRADSMPCHRFSPYDTIIAPYTMASTEMFAANQIQNRSNADPWRSESGIGLIPFVSIPQRGSLAGRESSVRVAVAMLLFSSAAGITMRCPVGGPPHRQSPPEAAGIRTSGRTPYYPPPAFAASTDGGQTVPRTAHDTMRPFLCNLYG